MIRPIPISDSHRNGFPFDVACIRDYTRRMRVHVYVRACVWESRARECMHKGATGLSRRLIYRRARYRTPRATICRRVVSLLIGMYSWTTVIKRCEGLEKNERHRFTLKLRNVSLAYLAYVVIRDIFVHAAHTRGVCRGVIPLDGAHASDEIFEFALKYTDM